MLFFVKVRNEIHRHKNARENFAWWRVNLEPPYANYFDSTRSLSEYVLCRGVDAISHCYHTIVALFQFYALTFSHTFIYFIFYCIYSDCLFGLLRSLFGIMCSLRIRPVHYRWIQLCLSPIVSHAHVNQNLVASMRICCCFVRTS